MIPSLFGSGATDIMVTLSIQVTVLAAAGWLASLFVRNAAARHCVLAAAVIGIATAPLLLAAARHAGLVLDVPIPAVFGGPPHEVGSAVPVLVNGPRPVEAAPERRSEAATASAETPEESGIAGAMQHSTSADPRPAARGVAIPWPTVLGVAWLTGTVVLLAGVVRAAWKTRTIRREAIPIDPGAAAAVGAAARRMGLAWFPEVRTSTIVRVPAVTGLLRPLVLVPQQDWLSLSGDELTQVLVHEAAHAVRRDPLWILLQRSSGALFWWHPLVHAVNRRLTQAREEICDNFVLRDTCREDYGNTLLRLARCARPVPAGALSLLGDGWRLEQRIAGILDGRRDLAIAVHRRTAVAVMVLIAALSLATASSRALALPAEPDAETAVADDFYVELLFRGESDKPYYHLVLHRSPLGIPDQPITLSKPIDARQAARIRMHLQTSHFFDRAIDARTNSLSDAGPRYVLQVGSEESLLREDLGWDLGTLYRLDALRTALDGGAAEAMDRLLGRLAGHRTEWEGAAIVDGLTTRLTAPSSPVGAGHPLPLKLEVINVGDRERTFGQHLVSVNHSFDVRNGFGQLLPYLRGYSSVEETQMTLPAGEARLVEEFDLAECYYLRRPGRYTVQFRGNGLPRSNCVHFEITDDPAGTADGDPVGRLLPLVRTDWTFVAGPTESAMLRPGSNWTETGCRPMSFVFNGPAYRDDAGQIVIWLAAEAAAPVSDPNSSLPHTDYLGRVGRWHIYYLASEIARGAWPSAQGDIVAALQDPPNQADAAQPNNEAAAPPVQQQREVSQFDMEQIHPGMQGSELWRDLRARLQSSAVRYRLVEIDEDGRIRLSLAATPTTDLSHLQGVPLWSLDLSNTGVRDLTPLEGMPLEVLDLSGTEVTDLTPLSGMRLTQLNLMGSRVSDLSPLREARLVQFVAIGAPIEDLSPLSGMPLEYLDLRRSRVHDLSPLAGLPLATMQLEDSPISDLTPLLRTPVKTLWLSGLADLDVSQLRGLSLRRLVLMGANVADIASLEGMPLEDLTLENTSVVDLTPVKSMPLHTLSLVGTPISDLSPLAGMSLHNVHLSEPATDLAPLQEMPLETITLPKVSTVINVELLRGMPHLKWIRPPECKPLTPEEFWSIYDSGGFGADTP